MDTFSPPRRREIMQSIPSRSTSPERLVRSYLHRAGLRFGRHPERLPGTPDIVLPAHRAVVLVHGCLWHGHDCPRGKLPKSNMAYWRHKVVTNQARDRRVEGELISAGWRVFIVWACDLRSKKRTDFCLKRLLSNIVTGQE